MNNPCECTDEIRGIINSIDDFDKNMEPDIRQYMVILIIFPMSRFSPWMTSCRTGYSISKVYQTLNLAVKKGIIKRDHPRYRKSKIICDWLNPDADDQEFSLMLDAMVMKGMLKRGVEDGGFTYQAINLKDNNL